MRALDGKKKNQISAHSRYEAFVCRLEIKLVVVNTTGCSVCSLHIQLMQMALYFKKYMYVCTF